MPAIDGPHPWTFPVWLALLLGGGIVSFWVVYFTLGGYFGLFWRRAYHPWGWRLALWKARHGAHWVG
jgi:hypothetical protein